MCVGGGEGRGKERLKKKKKAGKVWQSGEEQELISLVI